MHEDIFIAYSRHDLGFAETVEHALVHNGLRCYRDLVNIPGSAHWVEEITAAIDACHAVIVLVSETSMASDHVYRELTIAVESKKPILPILLSPAIKLGRRLRYHLAGHQHIVVNTTIEAALAEILTASWLAVDRSRHDQAYAHVREIDDGPRTNLRTEVAFARDRLGLFLGASDGGQATVENDAYVLAAAPQQWFGSRAGKLGKLTEGWWEVRIKKISGPNEQSFGVEFGETYPGNYYQVFLNGMGTVQATKRWQGQWHVLAEHSDLRQALRGDAENTLRVVREREFLHVFVNGLHALTVCDRDIRIGEVGFVVGPGLRVAFRDFQVVGTVADVLFKQAFEHWNRLEVTAARRILELIRECDPAFTHADCPVTITQLLWEPRPDRASTVLLVVGSPALAQLYDGAVAARLKDQINLRGVRERGEFGAVIADDSLLTEPIFLQCPIVSIGGPIVNKLTAQLADQLSADPMSTDHIRIHHNLSKGDRRVALWGSTGLETSDAVDLFISSGLITKYLGLIWK